MKKTITLFILMSFTICLLSACKGESLPMPDYPLEATMIEEKLSILGIECNIIEDEMVRAQNPEQSMYSLYRVEDDAFICAISSGMKSEERWLSVMFPPPTSPDNQIVRLDDSERAIAFVTSLYGGFETKEQVYNNFIKEYDTVNTTREQFETSVYTTVPQLEESAYWESDFDDTYFRIISEKFDTEEQESVVYAIVTSDWETFHSE